MKTKAKYIAIIIAVAAIIFIITLAEKNVKNTSKKEIEEKRESITFILGEDHKESNPYYAEATNFYLYNQESKTESVIMECRSLKEVMDYLKNHKPSNNKPWGLVNLVSHSNQWMGLSAKVTPHSKRATTERILEYIEADSLQALPNNVLDQKSELFIHGCGIGNNTRLVVAIGKAFGGDDDTLPKVKASKLFEYYTSTKENGVVKQTNRYYAKAWYTKYKRGYQPAKEELLSSFFKNYPGDSIDWEDALSREKPRFNGDIYHYTFDVTAKWVIKYENKGSLPDISSFRKQVAWVKSQATIMEGIEKMDIPSDKFNWWLRNVYADNDDGTKSPAIWAKGYCTILCVLQPLLADDDGQNPYIPEHDDKNFFYCWGGEKVERIKLVDLQKI